MCLIYDKGITRNLKRRLQRNGGRIQAWKVLTTIPIGKSSGTLFSQVFQRVWKVGWNQSNRRTRFLPKDDGKEVHQGIHVYLKKPSWVYVSCIVLVSCYTNDLIGAGWDGSNRAAVFQKVFLKRADYDQALSEKGGDKQARKRGEK